MKLKLLLFLTFSIVPNVLFAQYVQQGAKLVGTGAVGNARQGCSVAISADGNTAIVGGCGDNANAGAVWIFTRSGGKWAQQGQKLVGSDAVGTAVYQGISVSISADGNTAIEGGYGDNNTTGAAWIFTRSDTTWRQQGSKLVGSGAGGSGKGFSVAISGDGNTAIVGGPQAGAVWIFTRSGSTWAQDSMLVGTDAANAGLGNAVAISSDGNTVIAGGDLDYFSQGASQGSSFIFTRNNGVWTQQGPKLFAVGSVYASEGASVAISADGNTAMEGGPNDNGAEGSVGIFTRSGGVWSQQHTLLDSVLVGNGEIIHKLGGSGNNVMQGSSVALTSDGNTAIEGGPEDNSYVGAVWVFTRTNEIWTQLGTKLIGSDTVGLAGQGTSVAISANGAFILEGGPYDNNGAGAVWAFVNPALGVTPVASEVQHDINLSQNSPNPFNSSTVIKFNVPASGFVKMIVYDVFGKEVSTIVDQHLDAGAYQVDFDGGAIAGGTYFYRLEGEGFSEMKKMILVK